MQISNKLKNVSYIDSSNYDLRPSSTEIDLLVIHCASLPYGEFDNDNLENLFTGKLDNNQLTKLSLPTNLRVSTHVYINRLGKIFQFVPFDKRAWHAGISEYRGKIDCNNYSIGIELQGTADSSFTNDQYCSLVNVTESILKLYPAITKDRIVGHSDIAPNRKTDPGENFSWDRYLCNL